MKFAKLFAVFAIATMMLPTVNGAIIEQTPGLPGDMRRAGESMADGLQAAMSGELDDAGAIALVEAAERYERAGGDVDPELASMIHNLTDPMGRQVFSVLFRYAQEEPSIGQLRDVMKKQQDKLLQEVAMLDVQGIHESSVVSMGTILGKMNYSSSESLNASWSALSEHEQAFAVRLVADTGEAWARASDSPLAKSYGEIAAELNTVDPYAVVNGEVELPITQKAVGDIYTGFQDILLSIVSDDVYALDPNITVDDIALGDAIRAEMTMLMEDREVVDQARELATVAQIQQEEESLAAQTGGGGVWFPGGSYNPNNDAGSGRDTSPASRASLGTPATKSGLSYGGGLQPGDAIDAFTVDANGGPAIWTIYLTTQAGMPSLELNVSWVDGSGNPIPAPDPTHDLTEALLRTAPIPGAGGSADGTRATLHLPGSGNDLHIGVRLANGSDPAEVVPYLLTIERFEDNEALLSGVTRTEATYPNDADPYNGDDSGPVLFVHGILSSSSTWKQASDPWDLDQYLTGKYPRYAMLAVFLIYFLYMFKILYWDLLYIIVAPALFGIIMSPWLFLIVILVLIMQLIDIAMSLDHWLKFFQGVARVHSTRVTNGSTMVEYQKDAGFFVGTYEYHQKLGIAGTDLATPGSIKNAGENLRYGIDLLQSYYWNQQVKTNPGFNVRHPDDVKVALVGHSMGGLVSRWHVQISNSVSVGSMTVPQYGGDVSKLVQLASPNGGSTVAEWLADDIIDCTLLDMDELWYEMAKLVAALAMEIILYKLAAIFGKIFLVFGWLRAVSYFVTRIMHKIFIMLVVCATNVGVFRFFVADLIPERSTILPAFQNTTNPDVRYAIIYGIPFTKWDNNIKLFDIIVTEDDALLDGHYESVATSKRNYDTHVTMANDGAVMEQVRVMLAGDFGGDEPKAWGEDPLTVPDRVLFYWEYLHEFAQLWTVSKFKPSLFGLALRALVNKYTIAKSGTMSEAEEDMGAMLRTGNSRVAMQRLAQIKGLQPSAVQSLGMAPRPPEDVAAAMEADLNRGEVVLDVDRLAPDVVLLEVGDIETASQWFEISGEPVARRRLPVLPAEMETYRVMAIPPGGLAAVGSDPGFQRALQAFLADGGSVLAMDQPTGADWSTLPGGLRGFGWREAAAMKEGRVAMSTFAPALAGQWNALPEMSVDGHFTKWPANATVYLREEGSGNPVFLEYAWGGGTIAVTSLRPLTADGNRIVTDPERILLRDWTNAGRSVAPALDVAPNATVSLTIDVTNPTSVAVHNVTFSIVDPFLVVDNRTSVPLNVTLLPNETMSIPLEFTSDLHRGIWTIDARLRDENNSAVHHHYALARYTVSDFSANPDGFAYKAQPFALSVTSASEAVLRGEDMSITFHATNRGAEDVDASLQYWLPAMDARTGNASYGGPGYGLAEAITIPAGETLDVPATIAALAVDDVVDARLVLGNETVAQARRPVRAYDPSVELAVRPGSETYSSGDTLAVDVDVVDLGADAASRAGIVSIVVEDALGIPIHAVDLPATIGSNATTVSASFALGELTQGRHLIRASAMIDGLARGRALGGFEVPPRQLSLGADLPARIEAGEPAATLLTIENRGRLPVDNGSVTLTLLGPDGNATWNETRAFALAPAESTTLSFDVVSPGAAPGTHRLVADASTEDGSRRASWPLESRAAVRLVTAPTLFAGASIPVTLRVENTGAFVLEEDLLANVPTLGFSSATPVSLEPGATTEITLTIPVPADAGPGVHNFTTGFGASLTKRTLQVPGPRVRAAAPTVFGDVAAGSTLTAQLLNTGGIIVEAALLAELADATGHVVSRASLPLAPRAPGSTTALDVSVPADVASGAYRLSLTPTPSTIEGAGTLRASYDVSGVRAALALAPTATATDVGSTASALADVDVLDGSLAGATLLLQALDPEPLAAVERVAAGEDVTAMAAGDDLWVVLRGTTLTTLEAGALAPVAFPDALRPSRIDAIAARGAQAAIATELGVLRFDGAAWTQLADTPPAVSRLAFDASGKIWAGGVMGLHVHEGGAWVPVLEDAAVTALDADAGSVWAGLADLRTRLLPPISLAEPRTRMSYESELVTDAQGRMHAIFADGPVNESRVQHLLLDARGRVLAGPTPVSDVVARNVGGIAAQPLPDGRIAVTWHDDRGGGLDIYYRLLDAVGRPAADEVAITDETQVQRYPGLAVDLDGNVHLFWADERHPHPRPNTNLYRDELYHIKLAPDGTILRNEQRLTDSDAFVWQPRAVVDDAGLVHVVYTRVEIRFRFFFFPYAVFEVYHQALNDQGIMAQPQSLVSRDEFGFSWFPDAALDDTGALEVIWQDESAITHRRLSAATGAPLGAEKQIAGADADANRPRPRLAMTATGLVAVWSRPEGPAAATLSPTGLGPALTLDEPGAYFPRITHTADAGFALAWVGSGGMRFTRTTADPVGLGIARVDPGTRAVERYADDALASGIAATPAGALSATTGGLLSIDVDARAEALVGGSNATHVARAGEILAWAGAGKVGRFEDGYARVLGDLPGLATSAAAWDGDAWFGTSAGLVRLRSDTRNVLAETAIAIPGEGTHSASYQTPGPMKRHVLEGTLLNGAGQVLARAREQAHSLEGDLAMTIQPGLEAVQFGDSLPVRLTLSNRGNVPMRTLNVTLAANGLVVFARTIDLMAGDSLTTEIETTVAGATRLELRARQAINGGVDVTVRDFVPLDGQVRARVVGPVAANAEPFGLQLVLENDEDRARAVTVRFGADERVVALGPGAARVLAYEDLAQAATTTYRFTLEGDAVPEASLVVPQSAPPTARLDAADVMLPGRGETFVLVENPGLLPVRGVLRVEHDATILVERPIDLAPGDTLREAVTLDVAEGDNAIVVSAPGLWEEISILGSETPVVLVTPDLPAAIEPGDAIAITLRHRGPNTLQASLEWDVGFEMVRDAYELAPGESRTTSFVPDLHGVDAGAYPTTLRVRHNDVVVLEQPIALVVAEPPLTLTALDGALVVAPGEAARARVLVSNDGLTPTNARLRGSIRGVGEDLATARIAPGENATMTLAVPVPDDAVGGDFVLHAQVGEHALDIPVQILSYNATLVANVNRTLAPYAEPILVSATVTQVGTPRALEVRVRHGIFEDVLAIPAQAVTNVTSEMIVIGERPVEIVLQHAAGRVYGVRTIPLGIAANDTGFTAVLDRAEARAGETVRLTVTTNESGDVGIDAPSFKRNLTVDGTTTIAIPLPADLPTGEYTISTTFNFTASSQRVRVRGVEADGGLSAIAIPTAGGAPISGSLTIESPTAVQGELVVTLVDQGDVTLAQMRRTMTVGPGETPASFELPVPIEAAGPARVAYAFNTEGSTGETTLFRRETRIELPGTWIQEMRWIAHEGSVEARGIVVTTTPSLDLRVDTFLGSADLRIEGAGTHPYSLTIPVPENGNYPMTLTLTDGDGRTIVRKEAAFHDAPGVAPVTTLRVIGRNTTLDDELVVAPDTLFALEIVEEGSGLDRVSFRIDDEGAPYEGAFRLPPGRHNLSYRASDRALNSEQWQLVTIVVDGAAPVADFRAPTSGALVLAGAEVLPILTVGPEDGAYEVGLLVDGEEVVATGRSADTDRDGVPDEAEILLGTDPSNGTSLPSIPALPNETAPATVDTDGDGASDARETAYGSDPLDPSDAPWDPRPGSAPAFERPIVVLSGDLHVSFSAVDEVFPTTQLTVLLDGEARLTGTDAIDERLSLAGDAIGEHVLTLRAEDGLGNAIERRILLFVLPLAPEGIDATLAHEPRAPAWPTEFLHFLEEDLARLAGETQAALDAQVLRATLAAILVQDAAIALTPPAATGADEHALEDLDKLQRDVDECPCTSPPTGELPEMPGLEDG